MERESMEVDVLIVGAGPSGLAAAIRLKQLAAEAGAEIEVTVLEKGSEVGAHILSGAVLEPRALNELFPDWKDRGAPLDTPVSRDRFLVLGEQGVLDITWLPQPPCFGARSIRSSRSYSQGRACQLGPRSSIRFSFRSVWPSSSSPGSSSTTSVAPCPTRC